MGKFQLDPVILERACREYCELIVEEYFPTLKEHLEGRRKKLREELQLVQDALNSMASNPEAAELFELTVKALRC